MSRVIPPRPSCPEGHLLPAWNGKWNPRLAELSGCPTCMIHELDRQWSDKRPAKPARQTA